MTARCRRCRAAAKSLIDQLSALAKNPGDIYISIVPFAKDVNVGASYRQFDLDQLERLGRQERLPAPAPQLELEGQLHGLGLDAGRPQQMDRLLHRPRSELRHEEHDADVATAGTKFPAEQYSYCK